MRVSGENHILLLELELVWFGFAAMDADVELEREDCFYLITPSDLCLGQSGSFWVRSHPLDLAFENSLATVEGMLRYGVCHLERDECIGWRRVGPFARDETIVGRDNGQSQLGYAIVMMCTVSGRTAKDTHDSS